MIWQKTISSVEFISKQMNEFALNMSGNVFFCCERADLKFLICAFQCIYESSSLCYWKTTTQSSVCVCVFLSALLGILPATCAACHGRACARERISVCVFVHEFNFIFCVWQCQQGWSVSMLRALSQLTYIRWKQLDQWPTGTAKELCSNYLCS